MDNEEGDIEEAEVFMEKEDIEQEEEVIIDIMMDISPMIIIT